MKIFPLLCRIVPILMGIFILLSGALGEAKTVPNTKQTADRNSKFYLLLEDDSLYSNPPYQTEVKEIDRLGRAQDLKGLVRLADDIEQKWGHHADMRGYFALMDEVTNVFRSNEFGPKASQDQYLLTQKYVLETIAHDNVPLDITARLLPRLIPEEELILYKRPLSTSGWVKLRSTRAPLWLQTRQLLKQLVIPNYDFKGPTFLSAPPDLEELKYPDRPESRQKAMQRNKAIRDNNQKLQERNDQLFVRFQDKIFSPMAEEEMIAYYSQAPYDLQELKQLLDKYVEDAAIKQRILDQVAKNSSTNSQKK